MKRILATLILISLPHLAYAADDGQVVETPAGEAPKKVDKVEPTEKLSTNMDFDSTMIDGKMKAPAGFFLQGRNKQSLTNMVKLRSNFRPQLNDSKAAVKALVK